MTTQKHPVLVTGAAGFIGAAVCQRLLADGHPVLGIDNLNTYYDPALKNARLARLEGYQHFTFQKADIADGQTITDLFDRHHPHQVVHLAAQAGVRYSIDNPQAYVQSNLVGHMNILEACRHAQAEGRFTHLVYASSSSVYGSNTKVPFSETDPVEHPVSLYAATKRSNELLTESYCHLYGFPATGLRFFTVYGPWGRPDMAPMKFTKAILAGEAIPVFNHGDMSRDFTYIDDIVEGIVRLLAKPHAAPNQHQIYNIGNHNPVPLMTFIQTLETALNTKAQLNLQPMQPGDVPTTYADTAKIRAAVGFAPNTPLATGLQHMADWYREFYNL